MWKQCKSLSVVLSLLSSVSKFQCLSACINEDDSTSVIFCYFRLRIVLHHQISGNDVLYTLSCFQVINIKSTVL